MLTMYFVAVGFKPFICTKGIYGIRMLWKVRQDLILNEKELAVDVIYIKGTVSLVIK